MSFLLGGTQSFEDTLKGSFVRAKNNETHEDQICQDMQLKKYSWWLLSEYGHDLSKQRSLK